MFGDPEVIGRIVFGVVVCFISAMVAAVMILT